MRFDVKLDNELNKRNSKPGKLRNAMQYVYMLAFVAMILIPIIYNGSDDPKAEKGDSIVTKTANATECKNIVMMTGNEASRDDSGKVDKIVYPEGKSKTPGSLPYSSIIYYKDGSRKELRCAGKYLKVTKFHIVK